MHRIAFLVGVCLFSAGLAPAQTGPTPPPVWVNLKSGVYHCPGTEHYGTTSNGEYLPEATAIADGYHANGNRLCSPGVAAGSSTKPKLKAVKYAGPSAPTMGLTDCTVLRISDGDTFECKNRGRVRVIGIDAPETMQKPYGAQSKAALDALMPAGSKVQLSNGDTPRDKYGRILAYVWLDGRSVNWQMVRQGYALSYRYGADTLYSRWFDKAQSKAKSEHLGLWPLGGFDCNPYNARHGGC